ncbi:chemotaxis protein [Nitrosopumilus sp. b1]|uniref:methyl-accepting chemotaxis protein n=1 Tax=Nitrosopumilus sp. b1 TaxID=2109907 RepID=UPI0015F6009D|nr:cache domain-containing protein [Nitrosopumilus sp. b1]KAF6243111.1 chemotaxis protein [Nitrosopumilus sp. b1]
MDSIQKTTTEEKITIDSLDENIDESPNSETKNTSLDRVIEITKLMSHDTEKALDTINTINKKTEFLAINALIEASRTGDAGKGFQVVAESIDVLATKTKEAVEKMRKETISKMSELGKIIEEQSVNITGNRLADLALTNIDLIDRNLYERTADVRWWATDNIFGIALLSKTKESIQEAQHRLGTILKSYTVYYDLVLVDLEGNVITNAQADKFDISNQNFASKQWFQTALKTSNGSEYGFQSVHRSSTSGSHTMTFSCKVHENGDPNRPAIGVLAAVFNWDGLAQQVVNGTPINQDEKEKTRVCIVDENGTILADTQNRILDKFSIPKMNDLFAKKQGFVKISQRGEEQLVCHGLSHGYETYASGWHSVIIQDISNN